MDNDFSWYDKHSVPEFKDEEIDKLIAHIRQRLVLNRATECRDEGYMALARRTYERPYGAIIMQFSSWLLTSQGLMPTYQELLIPTKHLLQPGLREEVDPYIWWCHDHYENAHKAAKSVWTDLMKLVKLENS